MMCQKEDGKVEAKKEAVGWAGCKTRHRRSSSPYNTSHPDVKRENAEPKDEGDAVTSAKYCQVD